MFIPHLLIILIASIILTACEKGPNNPRGFSLPIGDIGQGEQVFKSTGCLSCHTIKGIEANGDMELEKPVALGGKITRVKTYGDLVTSIINPSHKIARSYSREMATQPGQSPMRNYNDKMTVTELVNLVTFLESKYELIPYEPSSYGVYYP